MFKIIRKLILKPFFYLELKKSCLDWYPCNTCPRFKYKFDRYTHDCETRIEVKQKYYQ